MSQANQEQNRAKLNRIIGFLYHNWRNKIDCNVREAHYTLTEIKKERIRTNVLSHFGSFISILTFEYNGNNKVILNIGDKEYSFLDTQIRSFHIVNNELSLFTYDSIEKEELTIHMTVRES